MFGFVWQQLVLLYRRGFALFGLAPLIIAIVVIPEFIQHVAEINMGMFDGGAHTRELANSPLRWAFGYAKLAGLTIGMLAAARYWGTRDSGGKWWRLGDVAWVPLIIGLVIFSFTPSLADLAHPWLPEWGYWTVYTLLSLAVTPLLFTILAALFGDRRAGPFAAYWRDWRWLPLLLVLVVAAYFLPMAAHYGFHRLAMGASRLLVWPLMAVDALAVGLLASLVGAALHLSYAAARRP